MRELSTTVSPRSTETCLWLSTAARESADIGSPWVPEISTVTFAGAEPITSCGRIRTPSGIVSSPSECAISEILRHAAAHDGHLAPEFFGNIQDLLDAVNRRAEAGDDDAPLGAVEDVLEPRPHGALGFRVPGAIGIGRVRQQQQHAALAVIGQRVQVEQLVIGGSRIDFEIAGVDHHPDRRRDGQRQRAHDRVRDVNKLDLERTDFENLARRNLYENPPLPAGRTLPGAAPPGPA